MKIVYPLAMDNWGSLETEAMNSVIESGRFTMGVKVKEFETTVSNYFGNKHTIMVNSGSSANLVMLTALKIIYGKDWPIDAEVIVPAISWSTTFTPLYYLGLKPVYVDVSERNFGINSQLVKNAISEKTVALLAVNILGQPAELETLRKICADNSIYFLEDNCESLGASLNSSFTGRFGIASSHSSFYSHHISTMEGGWISTDSDIFADTCRSLRAHGWIRETSPEFNKDLVSGDAFRDLFHFVLPGLNFRPLELEGALGVAQLTKFDEMLSQRRENAEKFKSLFGGRDFVQIQDGEGLSSWFAFGVILTGSLQGRRSEVAAALRSAGIESRPLIAGNFTRQPVNQFLKGRISGDLSISDRIHFDGMYIGNHPKPLHRELELAFQVISEISSKENS